MYATIKFTGLPARILNIAIKQGIASSKTDVIRFALLGLNREYDLVEDEETELAVKKMKRLDEETKAGKRKLLTEDQVFEKYPQFKHLRK